MSDTDFNINEADERAAALQLARTVCRYALAAVTVTITSISYCATHPDYQSRGRLSDQLHESRGALHECQRWTQ